MRAFQRVVIIVFLGLMLTLGFSCKKDEPNQAPECEFVQPADKDTIRIGDITELIIDASDPDGIVEELVVKLDDTELKKFTSSPFSFYWNTASAPGGWHKLKATAEDDAGEKDSHSIEVFLLGNMAPKARFLFTPDTGIVDQPMTFDASASSDPEDPLAILNFRWDWNGDGSFETGWLSNPVQSHTYIQAGSYSVSLEVKDSEGLVGDTNIIVKVKDPGLLHPVASFSVNPDSGNIQTTFEVDAGQSYDPDGDDALLQFRWDWDGDGVWDSPFLSNTVAAQIFTAADSYRIMLQVKDVDGLTDTISHRVIVSPSAVTGQPCPGTPAVIYGGEIYNTVQIGTQCWLKENLNIGSMVSSSTGQQNNAITEKFCYDNNPVNCDAYGGLYTWDEAMMYSTTGQGICPSGWHLPSDEEYQYLEGIADSQYDTLSGIWDSTGFRGYDAGIHLKASSGWTMGGNGDNTTGYLALPGGGAYGSSSSFTGSGFNAMHWTSDSEGPGSAMARYFDSGEDGLYRGGFLKQNAFSVRCIKD